MNETSCVKYTIGIFSFSGAFVILAPDLGSPIQLVSFPLYIHSEVWLHAQLLHQFH